MRKITQKNSFKLIMLYILSITLSCNKDSTTNTQIPASNSGIIFNPNLTYGQMSDIDGNIYKTIKIGNQTWMAENLKVTRYRNGDDILNVSDNTIWKNLSTGAYCNYNNDPTNTLTYGRLYNWFAVKGSRYIAPLGWHIPTDEEWTILTNYLIFDSIAGGKLKEIGTVHWIFPNINATNETGFTALPSGYRTSNGGFGFMNKEGYWWSSTERLTSSACFRSVSYGNYNVFKFDFNKHYGFSIRCIKN